MELHKAIKNILDSDGVDSLNDIRLVNILDDFRAFESLPASKYILRSIINDKYIDHLVQIGGWNSKSLALCQQFANATGFQFDYVRLVFQSIAYGLNYTDTVDLSVPNEDVKNNINTSSSSKFSHSHKVLLKKTPKYQEQYKEDAEEYLDSITEIKGDWLNELGVSVASSSVFKLYSDDSSISFNLEINGQIKLNQDKLYLFLKAVVYNKKGKIIGIADRSIYRDNFLMSYQVVEFGAFFEAQYKNITNISKIIFYWYV